MKYYIPTTTLNFNNILSSESISPYAFYKNRDFGYSRWYNIPENNQENSIILYDSLCNLKRPKIDMEDHPLIIEIETSEIFKKVEKGIFISDKTIYLNPWNTWFRFLSEQDKRVALSISDSSLETKMIPLYQKHFIVSQQEGSTFPLIEYNSEELNLSAIQNDRVINKLKGLLYGYYIGALLSCDAIDVKKYAIYKELYNISTSVLSNPMREASDEQKKRISILFYDLINTDTLIRKIEELYNEGSKSRELYWILTEMGCMVGPKMHQDEFLRQLKYGEIENNIAVKWVSDNLKEVNLKTDKNRRLLSPENSEIVVAESKLHTIQADIIPDLTMNGLFIGLVNYVLADNSITAKTLSQKSDLARKLTIEAKKIYGEKWVGSHAKIYLNELLNHTKGYAFNQDWDNGLLSSLAAVILRGDDWNGLLDFMKRKGMYDFRLAFAFYGLFNGFANLTRDFTDLLFCNNNRNYVADVYREIYGSIHGARIEVSEKGTGSDVPIIPEASNALLSRFSRKDVEEFFNTNILKVRKTSKQDNLNRELKFTLEILGDCNDSYVMVSVLNDCPTWEKNVKEWRKIRDKFCPNYDDIINIKENYNPKLEFPKYAFAKDVVTFFEQTILQNVKKDKKFQLSAELKFVLNRIENCFDPYIFVCVLNDSTLWKSKSEAWIKMQERFCPDYYQINGKLQRSILSNSDRIKSDNIGLSISEPPTLPGLEINEMTSDSSDSYIQISPVSNKEVFCSKTSFRLENLDLIFKVIFNSNPNLSDKGKKLVMDDLEWLLYNDKDKTELEALDHFQKLLKIGERGSGKGDIWKKKMEEYINLDIDTTIQALKEMIEK